MTNEERQFHLRMAESIEARANAIIEQVRRGEKKQDDAENRPCTTGRRRADPGVGKMIDTNDTQTQPLALDEQPAKAKRGRPATGKALSNAERQRAYRERQKAQRNENGGTGLSIKNQANYIARAYTAENRVEELETRIRELEAQLAQRNDSQAKSWTLQGRTGTGKWQNLAAGLDEKEASRQLDRVIDAKISGE